VSGLRLLGLLAVVGLALAVPAAADPPPPGLYTDAGSSSAAGTPPGLSAEGYALYGANCATCHGSRGVGVAASPAKGSGDTTRLGPPLRGVGALAADFYLRTGAMPLESAHDQPRSGRVLFSEHQLDALIAYVASLGKGPPVPKPHPERGNLGEGMQLFTENCAACHQVAAAGGIITGGRVPSLASATPVQVAEAVRIGPYVMPRFSPRQINDAQLNSIIRYVESTQSPNDVGGWGIGHLGPIPEGLVAWLIGGAALVVVSLLIGKRARA
jgi:ubiquinol-cytochrome c reductase cytochrome c subunit